MKCMNSFFFTSTYLRLMSSIVIIMVIVIVITITTINIASTTIFIIIVGEGLCFFYHFLSSNKSNFVRLY